MSATNIFSRICRPPKLSLKSHTGHIFQIRNHVKMYPWRHLRSRRECNLDPTRTPYTDRHNVNELMVGKKQRKDWQKVIPKERDTRYYRYQLHDNYESDPLEARKTAEDKFRRFQQGAESRGFARERPAYSPPERVHQRVLAIYKQTQLESKADSTPQSDDDILAIDLNENRALKFNLITKCIEEFAHDLPTSSLNDVQYIGDLIHYYSTPVRGVNPYSQMLNQETSLPVNLSLLAEPVRFDKANDTFFHGYNALPGLVGKVPGPRAAKKYPVLNQDEFQWPDI